MSIYFLWLDLVAIYRSQGLTNAKGAKFNNSYPSCFRETLFIILNQV